MCHNCLLKSNFFKSFSLFVILWPNEKPRHLKIVSILDNTTIHFLNSLTLWTLNCWIPGEWRQILRSFLTLNNFLLKSWYKFIDYLEIFGDIVFAFIIDLYWAVGFKWYPPKNDFSQIVDTNAFQLVLNYVKMQVNSICGDLVKKEGNVSKVKEERSKLMKNKWNYTCQKIHDYLYG